MRTFERLSQAFQNHVIDSRGLHCATRAVLLGCVAAALLSGCPPADGPFIAKLYGVETFTGVVYDEVNGLALDIYTPLGAGVPALKPALLLIHGGSFVEGSRADDRFENDNQPGDFNTPMAEYAEEFARRGYVCVAIDYRKAYGSPGPTPTGALAGLDFGPGAAALDGLLPTPVDAAFAQTLVESAVRDAELAYDLMVANAGDYGVDPARIAVGGYSAGAITALFVHARGRGAACWSNAGSFGGGSAPGFGGVSNDRAMIAAALAGANPAFNVIAFQGQDDQILPANTFGASLRDALVSTGAPHEYYAIPGEDHFFLRTRQVAAGEGGSETVEDEVADYLFRRLDLFGL